MSKESPWKALGWPLHTPLALALGLSACASSAIPEYCTVLASCTTQLSCDPAASDCDEMRIRQEEDCVAELEAHADALTATGLPNCMACVEATDKFRSCAADVDQCDAFFQAQEAQCLQEYEDYRGSCSSSVNQTCDPDPVSPQGSATPGQPQREPEEAS